MAPSMCPPGKIGTLNGPDHPSPLSSKLRPYRMMIVVGESRE